MKRLSLIFMFLFAGTFIANAQDCCNGFEANFTYHSTQTPHRIEFQNLSSGNSTFIVWNFGDGTTSNGANPDHTYSEPGIYQVCVVIENNDCRSELCYEVAVETANPCNDFLADYLWSVNPSNSLGVQFDNISPSPSNHYIWHFGDGSSSDNQEPYHEYSEGGMYQVCLVLESGDCRSEYCREVCVTAPAPEPPTAANCCDGFEANFNYFSTQTANRIEFQNQSEGDWDFIVWNYGDGTTSNLNSPDHIFPHPGIYQVCVVIESNDGCRSELCYEVPVETTPNPCNDFLADFVWNEHIDSLGIQFENISQGNAGVYIWHFGDGSTSHDQDPYHEYAHPGVYQVCLVVENNDGCRSEYCRSVCVEDFNPCAGFEVSFNWSAGVNNNHRIEFDGLYSGNAQSITWHFGDGSTSDAENPVHEYNQSGMYEVCISADNNEGCHSEYCHTIAVDVTPDPCENFEADFTWVVDLEHGGVHFENLSTGNPTSYTWHFGDDTFSHDQELTHHYSYTGAFQVCLHIENGDGCSAEICQMVYLPSYYFYVSLAVGVNELSTESSLAVYPNPFEDVVRFNEPISGTLQILDVQGRMVVTKQVSAVSSINLSGLKTGLYLMRISDKDLVRTVRVLKQ
ncbi:MAG: PKD domain-containing protein [Flavobacteriales bacterium]|jgi:PKD repeat protein|nr:PKD domain-containing protein [Flavobacteriales bacterium]